MEKVTETLLDQGMSVEYLDRFIKQLTELYERIPVADRDEAVIAFDVHHVYDHEVVNVQVRYERDMTDEEIAQERHRKQFEAKKRSRQTLQDIKYMITANPALKEELLKELTSNV